METVMNEEVEVAVLDEVKHTFLNDVRTVAEMLYNGEISKNAFNTSITKLQEEAKDKLTNILGGKRLEELKAKERELKSQLEAIKTEITAVKEQISPKK